MQAVTETTVARVWDTCIFNMVSLENFKGFGVLGVSGFETCLSFMLTSCGSEPVTFADAGFQTGLPTHRHG